MAAQKNTALRFVESYPWLEAAPLMRALQADDGTVVSWADAEGEVIASASVFPTESGVCAQNAEDIYEETLIDVVRVRAGGAGDRTVFLCPGCAQKSATLYLDDRKWRCRRCHGLTYSTKYDTATQKKIREYDIISARTSLSRRRFQRIDSHAADLARLDELDRDLAVARRLEAPRERLQVRYGMMD